MDTNGLKVVPEKRGLIILNGQRENKNFEVKFRWSTIAPTNHLKFLGVTFGANNYMVQHVIVV